MVSPPATPRDARDAQPEAVAHDLANAKELDGPIAGRTVEEVKLIAKRHLTPAKKSANPV